MLKGLKGGSQTPIPVRNFERGVEIRKKVLDSLMSAGFLMEPKADLLFSLSEKLSVFSAFVASTVAGLYFFGKTIPRPIGLAQEEGWVVIPKLTPGESLQKETPSLRH